MILRLDNTGNRAKQILRRGGKRKHPMAFQLTKADDRVRVVEISRVSNVLCDLGRGQIGLFLTKITVQLRTRCLSLGKSAGAIDRVQVRRGKRPARTVPDNDVRTLFAQQMRQHGQECRMRRRGFLRLHGRDKICLDDHAHSPPDPFQSVKGRKRLAQRTLTDSLGVIFAAHDRNIHASLPLFSLSLLKQAQNVKPQFQRFMRGLSVRPSR